MLPHNIDLGVFLATLNAAWHSAGLAQMPIAYLFGPGLLLGIFGIHAIYYRKAAKIDGQQVIAIDDLTSLGSSARGTSVVLGDGVEFCAIQGRASSCDLPVAPPTVSVMTPRSKRRFTESVTIGGKDVLSTLICAEDLTVDDKAIFHAPVKVGGDMLVRGNVYFDQTVVVNGVLKIEGHAIFARGIIAKGDVVATGDITIGTRETKGWAVFRNLTLASRLKLNGQIISDQDLALPKAA